MFHFGLGNDIDRRIWEHDSGYNSECYTYKRRPVQLVFQEHFKYIDRAIAFEKQIKGWRREKKEALISGDWEILPELSKRYSE